MRTLAEILSIFWDTTAADWKQHENGGGWVHSDARVEATCRVEGIVYDNARVSGVAWVSGDAWASSPLQIQGSVHFATNCQYGHIQIESECHTFAEWSLNFEKIGQRLGYSEAQIVEYKAIVDLFCSIGRPSDAVETAVAE